MSLKKEIEKTKAKLQKSKKKTQQLQDELFLLIAESIKKGHKAP